MNTIKQFFNTYKIIGGSFLAGAGVVGFLFWMHVLDERQADRQAMQARVDNPTSVTSGFASADAPVARVDFGDFWTTWSLLEEKFAPQKDKETTIREQVASATAGLASAYQDPYTAFLPTKQAETLKTEVDGTFKGIGAVLSQGDRGIVVQEIVKGSPAEQAGLLAGDSITSIDDVPVAGEPLERVIAYIRGGELGSVISLGVIRAPHQNPQIIKVTRGTVVIPTTTTRVIKRTSESVKALATAFRESIAPESMTVSQKDSEYLVLTLSTFSKSSMYAFVSELSRARQEGINYIIIDLRNNPGGYIDVAVDLASYFLPKDTIIVRERVGKNLEYVDHVSRGYTLLGDLAQSAHIAVLVNGGSASASEIFAGAMQDTKRGIVVGEQTYGKGSVQELVDVGSLGSLKVTIARWFTPLERSVSEVGLTPDVIFDPVLEATKDAQDPLLDQAIGALVARK